LTDAHCHPTDDPTLSSGDPNGAQKLAQRLQQIPLEGACAMGSCTEDQVLVRRLAEEMHKMQLRPCFGYHPWYSHSLSLEHPPPPREEHYRSLLLTNDSSQQARDELGALLPHLPTPRSLKDILEEIRNNLRAFPNALLGEVGLDRAFRIPTSKEAHTLALRGKRLTSLGVPIGHQCKVLLAQIGVAVEEGRSISCHSVRAGEATVELIRECCRVYNGANLDLHSCTMSAEQLKEILRHHPNIFVSFSTTINARQKGLISQLAIVPPTRLLVESDWHSAEQLAGRNWDVLKLVA
ncbi:Metallo-dependent hydrolase, partial [Microstroma glucosiphilum]